MHANRNVCVIAFLPTVPTGEGTVRKTVSGRSTDKWLFKNKKNGNTTTAWLDKKIHFPIRTTTSEE